MQQQNRLPGLVQLQQLIAQAPAALRAEVLAPVQHRSGQLPRYGLTLGNPDPTMPAPAYRSSR